MPMPRVRVRPLTRDQVPYEMRHLLCTCPQRSILPLTPHSRNKRPCIMRRVDGSTDLVFEQSPYMGCAVCGNYGMESLLVCRKCDTLFVRYAFDHPNQCVMDQHCLGCLDEATEPVCVRTDVDHRRCRSYTERVIWDEFALTPRNRADATLSTTSLAELDLDF